MEVRRKRGVATYLVFPLVDAGGQEVTGLFATPKYATFTDGQAPNTKFSTLSNATISEVSGTGWYYASLTATEMANDYIVLWASPTSGGGRPARFLVNCLPVASVTQVQNPVPLLWSSITDAGSTVSLSGTTIATISNPVPLNWGSITNITTAQNLSATRFASVNSPVALLWSSITGTSTTQTLSGTTIATTDGVTSSVSPDWGRVLNPGTSVNLSLTKIATVSNPVPLLWSSITDPSTAQTLSGTTIATADGVTSSVSPDWGRVLNPGTSVSLSLTRIASVNNPVPLLWSSLTGTSASQTLSNTVFASLSSAVTVVTNNDKTGYSLGAGGVTASSFAAGAIDDAALAADAFVGLNDTNIASGTDIGTNAYRTWGQVAAGIRNKTTISAAGAITVTKTDDSTTSWSGTVSTTSDTSHISGVDPT